MNIAIVTNMNGIGLQRDYELLLRFLQEQGHIVQGFQYDEPVEETLSIWTPEDGFQLVIFLEVVPRDKIGLAPVRWAFLNPEWCKRDVIDAAKLYVNRVFAKTHEAFRILEEIFPNKTFYTGFLTRDQMDEAIPRQQNFLHIGGNSSLRGTQAVLDAWKWEKNGRRVEADLTIISTALTDRPEIPHVRILERVSEEELKFYQNSCLFHLFPSGTEGFGHALHEATSVNAIILTTHAPPMFEIESSYRIKPCGTRSYNLATVYDVSALDIYDAVMDLVDLGRRYGRNLFNPRREFEAGNRLFKELLTDHLASMGEKKKMVNRTVKTEGAKQIAFLGNFGAPESTENMVKWALEEGLGHAVWPIQENEARLSDLETAAETCDVFLWVRTPGWLMVSDSGMVDFLRDLERRKIPSLSLHLDKFFGIPEREALIGVHPFWKTQFVWTADGSNDEGFKKLGVNHFWMKPAVSEVYCHPGTPRDHYRCDVAFVGAAEYHAEYPFRKQLVDFLKSEYADFQHITTIRGHELNDFYASARVVVGDCIFAGTPNYWSDRVPETIGRGGFLLHPAVNGMIVPLAVYKPQSLDDVKLQINHWLKKEKVRLYVKRLATQHVRKYDTWTERMREILEASK